MERTVFVNPSVSASLAGITLAQCSVCTRVSSTISEFDASVGVASAPTEHSALSKAFVTERDGAGLCDFFPLAEHSGAGA